MLRRERRLLLEEELEELRQSCKELKSMKFSVLRTKVADWVRDGEKWKKSS